MLRRELFDSVDEIALLQTTDAVLTPVSENLSQLLHSHLVQVDVFPVDLFLCKSVKKCHTPLIASLNNNNNTIFHNIVVIVHTIS